MDWETEELRAFRRRVRETCETLLPQDIKTKAHRGLPLEKSDIVTWEKILASQGWLVGHWPTEYGGLGWTPLERYVFLEETALMGAPRIAPFGVNYVGPVIYTFGSQEQKDRFLPGIRSSQTWWAQGYSEPGAGSDLAALTTQAILDGDHYRVTGQKTWTSSAHWADMMFCLVRTSKGEKKQQGISFLLIDMKSPGITVRPIRTLDLGHEVNDVFLDDVRVPVTNRVGDEGSGWKYGKFLLGNERMTTISAIGRAKSMMTRLWEQARLVWEGGRPIAETRDFQRQACELEISIKVLEAMCVRQLSSTSGDGASGAGASILKFRSTQITQAIAQRYAELMMRSGLRYDAAALKGEEVEDVESTGLLRSHLFGRASTIYGGAAEVQKDIIAKVALGL